MYWEYFKPIGLKFPIHYAMNRDFFSEDPRVLARTSVICAHPQYVHTILCKIAHIIMYAQTLSGL